MGPMMVDCGMVGGAARGAGPGGAVAAVGVATRMDCRDTPGERVAQAAAVPDPLEPRQEVRIGDGLRARLAQTDYERMTAGIRHTGIAIGNAHVCTGPDGKAAFLEEAHHMFDLILQDVGSELA